MKLLCSTTIHCRQYCTRLLKKAFSGLLQYQLGTDIYFSRLQISDCFTIPLRMQMFGDDVNLDSLFDVQIKRIHEYKRQHLNVFSIIHRYKELKAMTPEQRKQVGVCHALCEREVSHNSDKQSIHQWATFM
eukprot:592220-Pelagomonas_calceolata.AAC.1